MWEDWGNNHFTEMCSGSEAGSYLRLIYSCITQLKSQGPARTCNESKEEEEEWGLTWDGFDSSLRDHPTLLYSDDASEPVALAAGGGGCKKIKSLSIFFFGDQNPGFCSGVKIRNSRFSSDHPTLL